MSITKADLDNSSNQQNPNKGSDATNKSYDKAQDN